MPESDDSKDHEHKEAVILERTEKIKEALERGADMSEDLRDAVRAILDTVTKDIVGTKIDKAAINHSIADIDKRIGAQLDTILHHHDFKKLESAWTSLHWLVSKTDFSQNTKMRLLNASKEDLLRDFEEAEGELNTTGLYQKIYTGEYGSPNGEPYGAMVFDYEFSHKEKDIALLGKIAEVAKEAHAPVIGGVSPELFGEKGFENLTDNKFSVKEHLEGKAYAKWNGFREKDVARYVGLALPRFLLRTPYNPVSNSVDAKEFMYEENVEGKHENYLWGNSAFAVASRITDAFAKYRWCDNIMGEESGGLIEDLKMHDYQDKGKTVQKPPTEVQISFEKQKQLDDAGVIPLMWLKRKDQAVIYHALSMKEPGEYPDTEEGNAEEKDENLRVRFPYMFISTRFAHYLKRLQTRYIGQRVTADTIKDQLNKWVKQYVNAAPNPVSIRNQPLSAASIEVVEDEKVSGVFHCKARLTPHTKAWGFSTDIILTTRQQIGKSS